MTEIELLLSDVKVDPANVSLVVGLKVKLIVDEDETVGGLPSKVKVFVVVVVDVVDTVDVVPTLREAEESLTLELASGGVLLVLEVLA